VKVKGAASPFSSKRHTLVRGDDCSERKVCTISPRFELRTTVDLKNIIQSLEEFVYEIALWPVLLPVTFFRFAFQPTKTSQYVNAELDKPADQRYAQYLSPILYWLLVSAVPTFLITNTLLTRPGSITNHTLGLFFKQSVETRFTESLIFLIWLPLSFAIGSLLRQRIPVTREALRKPFYTQCMILAPFIPTLVLVYIKLDEARRINQDITKQDPRFWYFWPVMMFVWVGAFMFVERGTVVAEGTVDANRSMLATVGTFIIAILLLGYLLIFASSVVKIFS
jgi:hypothetical protein